MSSAGKPPPYQDNRSGFKGKYNNREQYQGVVGRPYRGAVENNDPCWSVYEGAAQGGGAQIPLDLPSAETEIKPPQPSLQYYIDLLHEGGPSPPRNQHDVVGPPTYPPHLHTTPPFPHSPQVHTLPHAYNGSNMHMTPPHQLPIIMAPPLPMMHLLLGAPTQGNEDHSKVEPPVTPRTSNIPRKDMKTVASQAELMSQAEERLHLLLREQEQQNKDLRNKLQNHSTLLNEYFAALPSIEYAARLQIWFEYKRSYDWFSIVGAVNKDRLTVCKEEEKARAELMAVARSDYLQSASFRFTIDTTTPKNTAKLEDSHTAVKTADGWATRPILASTPINRWVTFRAAHPLTKGNHRWAVKIRKVGISTRIMLGVLPKMPMTMEKLMDSRCIDLLEGWCIYQFDNESHVRGKWRCEPLPFSEDDLVFFDYSFSDKMLTIRCRSKQVVGRIPVPDNADLYPAFSLGYSDTVVSFENYSYTLSKMHEEISLRLLDCNKSKN